MMPECQRCNWRNGREFTKRSTWRAEQIHCFRPPKCCARVVDDSNSPQTHLVRLLHRCVVLTLDGDSYRLLDHQHEPESGGLAYAAHGVAASPTPMPRATANAPMRPMHFAYPR